MAMKSRKNLLAVLAVSVIAMAVAIAGCSSNGDNGGTPPATTPTVAELFATAQIAKTAALTASKEAADILGGATDSSAKFDIKSVKGESAKATENAQKAVYAKIAADEAVTAAEAALTSAEEAEEKGNDLPANSENSENRKTLITAIKAAIKAAVTAAHEQVGAAEAPSRFGGSEGSRHCGHGYGRKETEGFRLLRQESGGRGFRRAHASPDGGAPTAQTRATLPIIPSIPNRRTTVSVRPGPRSSARPTPSASRFGISTQSRQ